MSVSVFDGNFFSDPVYLVVGILDANDNPPKIFISPSPEVDIYIYIGYIPIFDYIVVCNFC